MRERGERMGDTQGGIETEGESHRGGKAGLVIQKRVREEEKK